MARLLIGIAWLFTLVAIGALIANGISDDPEYYVPLIAATIAVAPLLLAGHLRRKADESARR